jgi:hypothetical protein
MGSSPRGIVLGSFTLLCGYAASLVLLFGVNKKNPILAAVVGFVLLLGCPWVLEKCLRLLTGRQNPRWPAESHCASSRVIFLSNLPDRRPVYWILLENGCGRGFSGANVRFFLFGPSEVGSEARS